MTRGLLPPKISLRSPRVRGARSTSPPPRSPPRGPAPRAGSRCARALCACVGQRAWPPPDFAQTRGPGVGRSRSRLPAPGVALGRSRAGEGVRGCAWSWLACCGSWSLAQPWGRLGSQVRRRHRRRRQERGSQWPPRRVSETGRPHQLNGQPGVAEEGPVAPVPSSPRHQGEGTPQNC